MSNLTLNPTRNLTLASRAVLIAAALDAVPGALDGVAYGDTPEVEGLTIHAGPPAPHVRLSNAELLAVAMADATAPAPATDFGGVA